MAFRPSPQTTFLAATIATLTVGTALILSGFTQGSVLFVGASSTVSQDNANFAYDDATDRLSVTNLTITGNCVGCGSSNLNQAYLAATGSPEIAITPSIGAVTIANAQGGVGTIFEVQDRVDAAGNFSKRNFMVASASSSFDFTGNSTTDGLTITGGTSLTSGYAATITGGGASSTTGGVLNLTGSSAGTGTVNSVGHVLNASMASNPSIANNGGMAKFTCTGCTTGNNTVIAGGDSQTTGQNLLSVGRGSLTTGSLFKVDKFAAAARTTAFTGSIANFSHVDTYTGGGSTSNTGNTALFTRTINVTNAAATPVYSGALMSLNDNTSVSAGSITHSASVLDVNQNYSAATGDVFKLTSAATGARLMSLTSSVANSSLTTNLFSIGAATKDLMTVSATSTAFAGSTGSVSANAVTCNGTLCRITDTTDINLASTRAAITLTNSAIASTSNVHVGLCGTQDSGAMIIGSAVPGAGSATIIIANAGTGNQTTTLDICVTVFGNLP